MLDSLHLLVLKHSVVHFESIEKRRKRGDLKTQAETSPQ